MRVAEFLKVKRYIRVLFPVSRRCLDLLLQFYGNHILLSPPSVRECCIIELAFMAWEYQSTQNEDEKVWSSSTSHIKRRGNITDIRACEKFSKVREA